jgi:hypothetical protein
LSAAVFKVVAGFMELFPQKLIEHRHNLFVTVLAVLVLVRLSPVRADD